VHSFCDRWHGGVDALAKDGAALAELLAQTAVTYQEADTSAAQALYTAAASWVDSGQGAPVAGLEAQ
jgi:hypothetical protein